LKRFLTVAALFALLPQLAACDEDNERTRSAVEISRVNSGGVFVCGMLDAGADNIAGTADDFVPAGHVPVVVKNRPYNPFIQAPDYAPFGHFHITRVRVTWDDTGPSTPMAELTPFEYAADYDIVVPTDPEVEFNVMLVPFYMKDSPYFIGLLNGANPSFTAQANIALTGHDSGSDSEVTLRGSVIVEFIPVIAGDN